MNGQEERRFKCTHPGCQKSFNRRDYLVRHSANLPPHKCPQCPQRFARADLLEKHLNTKSHEKRRKREEKRMKVPLINEKPTLESKDIQQATWHSISTHQPSEPQPKFVSSPSVTQLHQIPSQIPRTPASSTIQSQRHISSSISPATNLHFYSSTTNYTHQLPHQVFDYGPRQEPISLLTNDNKGLTLQPVQSHQPKDHPDTIRSNSLPSNIPTLPSVTSVMPPPQTNYSILSPNTSPINALQQSIPPSIYGNQLEEGHKHQINFQLQTQLQEQSVRQTVPGVSSKPRPVIYSALSDLERSEYRNVSSSTTDLTLNSDLAIGSRAYGSNAVSAHPHFAAGSDPYSNAEYSSAKDLQSSYSHLDFNISGNYAWLFGSDFWETEPSPTTSTNSTEGGGDMASTSSASTSNTSHSSSSSTIPHQSPSLNEKNTQIPSANTDINGHLDIYVQSNVRAKLQESGRPYKMAKTHTNGDYLDMDYLGSLPLGTQLDRLGTVRNDLGSTAVDLSNFDYEYKGVRGRLESAPAFVKEQKRQRPVSNILNSTPATVIKTPLLQSSPPLPPSGLSINNQGFSPLPPATAPNVSPLKSHFKPIPEQIDVRPEIHIDESSRAKMLTVLKDIPSLTLTDNAEFFSCTALSSYMDLYWNYFDVLYPIIHRSTFVTSNINPELLVAMCTIGMAYTTDNGAYELAMAIHKKFRNILLVMIEDRPRVALWVHQCLLLTNYFVKILGSNHQFEMSQMFHGTNIAMLRLSGYLSDLREPTPLPGHVASDPKFWTEWVDYESAKRATFFAFICDAQHATMFRHTLALSAFEINLELPCTDACWNASSPVDFWGIFQKQPRQVQQRPRPDMEELAAYSAVCSSAGGNISNSSSTNGNGRAKESGVKEMLASGIRGEGNWPSLLFSIRRMMTPYRESQKEYSLECFSQFTRLILLHGLLSISWDMQWRGLLDMGIVSKRRMNEFRARIVAALISWRGYFDRQLRDHNNLEFNQMVSTASTSGGSSSLRSSAASSPSSVHSGSISSASGVFSRDSTTPRSTESSSWRSSDSVLQLNHYGSSPLLCSNWALYHLGLIILHADTLSLRIFAEGNHQEGNNVSTSRSELSSSYDDNVSVSSSGTSERSKFLLEDRASSSIEKLKAHKAVYGWASSEDAQWAVWHSVQFLRRVLTNELLLNQTDHMPWCAFIATLTLWAYEVGQCKQQLSSAKYRDSSVDASHHNHNSNDIPFVVNMEIAKQDALRYVELVEAYPPRAHRTTEQYDNKKEVQELSGKRAALVMGITSYFYSLLKYYNRGVGQRGSALLLDILKRHS